MNSPTYVAGFRGSLRDEALRAILRDEVRAVVREELRSTLDKVLSSA